MLQHIKSTLKNSIIYGFGNLATKIVGFILLPLYTKHLSVADYGVLGIIEVTSQVFIGIFGFSLYQSLFRWYWEKENIDKRKSIFFTCLSFLFISSIIVSIIISQFSGQLSNMLFNSEKYSMVLKLMCISSAFEILITIPNTLIRLQEKPKLFTVSNIIRLFTSLVLTIYFIKYLHLNVEGIYLALICGQLTVFLVLNKYIRENITWSFEMKILKKMLLYSVPLALSSLSAIILSFSDRYILKFLGSLNDVGLYSMGYKIANTLNVFIVTSVNLAISPLIFKKMDDADNKWFYAKLLTYYIYGLMFFVLGMSFFGKELIKLLSYNRAFFDAYNVVPFIAYSTLFMVMKDIALTGLLKMKKSKLISIIILVSSIITIVLDILLIPLFKSIGAAIAVVISQFIYFVLVYIYAQKYYRIPFEIRKLLIILFTGAVLIYIGTLFNDQSLTIRIIAKSVLIILYPFVLYLFRMYEQNEIKTITEIFRKSRKAEFYKSLLKKF